MWISACAWDMYHTVVVKRVRTSVHAWNSVEISQYYVNIKSNGCLAKSNQQPGSQQSTSFPGIYIESSYESQYLLPFKNVVFIQS